MTLKKQAAPVRPNFAMRPLLSPLVCLLLSFILLQGCASQRPSLPATGALSVRATGAVGDGKTKDTAAIQAAIDQVAAQGGGEVLLPEGEYLSGSIELKSNVTLRLAKGATLAGSPDLADYPLLKVRWEGRWVEGHRALVAANGAQNIAIVGEGHVAANLTLGNRQMPRRPAAIEPIDCRIVLIEGLRVTQQRMWTLHPTYCENIVVRNLVIRGIGGNSDGVDIDSCKRVLIEGCDIETGDDCIAIKSGRGMEGFRLARATEDVVIRNCTFGDNIFACIGIGSETSGGIRKVHIQNCTFKYAKTSAIYIKSRPGRGAFIENITADNLDVNVGQGSFLRINLLKSGLQDPEPVPGLEGVPSAKQFRFSKVRVACGKLVDAVDISPEKPVDGLVLEDISGTCSEGIRLANLKNVELRDIKVTGYTGPLLGINNVTGTGLEGAVEIPPTPAPAPVLPAN